MVSQEVKIINASGLHLRPAGSLCKEALKYEAKVQLLFGDTIANAKSVLSVLGACVKVGDVITIACSGRDEEEALENIITLIRTGFGEV